MSRLVKHLVNRAFLTENSPLRILLISGNYDFDNELISECERHKFYVLGKNKFYQPNVFLCEGEHLIKNLSYEFDCVLTTSPYRNFNNAVETSVGIRIPAIFVHTEVPQVKKELLFGAAHSLERFINVTPDKSITDSLHLYGAKEKQGTWESFLNELLCY
jgi:hypothetical protein